MAEVPFGHGKALYVWEPELECFLPCCVECRNGPLIGEEEAVGLCVVCDPNHVVTGRFWVGGGATWSPMPDEKWLE